MRNAILKSGVVSACLCVAGPLSAQITSVDFIDNGIYLDFDGRLTGMQLLIELTEGSVLNPDASVMPSGLAGDTYVALGSGDRSFGTPAIAGYAADLQIDSEMSISGSAFNLAWYAPISVDTTDQADFLSAQVALTPDASGTFSYLASAEGAISRVHSVVTDGQLIAGSVVDDVDLPPPPWGSTPNTRDIVLGGRSYGYDFTRPAGDGDLLRNRTYVPRIESPSSYWLLKDGHFVFNPDLFAAPTYDLSWPWSTVSYGIYDPIPLTEVTPRYSYLDFDQIPFTEAWRGVALPEPGVALALGVVLPLIGGRSRRPS